MRTALVTGHRGQVGSWVMETAPHDLRVVGVDLRDADPIDICSPRASVLASEADVVLHLAALIDVVASVKDPGPTWRTNVEGTRNLLAALRPGSHIVFVSSAAVYGDAQHLPIREDAPLRPLSPYGESKLEGERLVRTLAPARGATWTIVRPFNIYSSRQDPRNPYSGVITKFMQASRAGAPLTLFGDGTQTRDFVHASDVARALWMCAQDRRAHDQVFNVACGRATSIADLARLIAGGGPVRHEAARPGEIAHSVADTSRLRDGLGWQPLTRLEDGLEEVRNPAAAPLPSR